MKEETEWIRSIRGRKQKESAGWGCHAFFSCVHLSSSSLCLAASRSLVSTCSAWRGVCVGWQVLWANLDPVGFIVDVEHSLLNLLVDLTGCVDEGLLNVGCCLCRCLHEDETMLSGKSFTFFLLYFTSGLQVTGQKQRCHVFHLNFSKSLDVHLLLPMSMMTMLEFECWRASSSHVVKWLNVSLLVMSYTNRAPAAPR